MAGEKKAFRYKNLVWAANWSVPQPTLLVHVAVTCMHRSKGHGFAYKYIGDEHNENIDPAHVIALDQVGSPFDVPFVVPTKKSHITEEEIDQLQKLVDELRNLPE